MNMAAVSQKVLQRLAWAGVGLLVADLVVRGWFPSGGRALSYLGDAFIFGAGIFGGGVFGGGLAPFIRLKH
jgi:hypothetical protein